VLADVDIERLGRCEAFPVCLIGSIECNSFSWFWLGPPISNSSPFAFKHLNLERGEFLMTGRSTWCYTASRDICVTPHFTRVFPDHVLRVRAGQRPPD